MSHRNSIGFRFLLVLLAVAAGQLCFAPAASAAATVFTWAPSSQDWGASANWSPAGPPNGSNAIAQFPSASYAQQPTLVSSNETTAAIWDNGTGNVTISASPGYALSIAGTTVNGNTITGLEVDGSAGSLTINSPITLVGTTQRYWNNNSPNPVTINGTFNWGGLSNVYLNSSGSGALVVAGSLGNIGTGNNYLGNVTITGTVATGQTQFTGEAFTTGLANTSGTTTVAAGGMLNMQTYSGTSYLVVQNYLIVNGGTIQRVGTTTNTTIDAGWVAGYAGVLTVNSGLVNLNGETNVSLGHAVAGTINLNGGTFILSSEVTNANDGGTFNLNGGTLQLGGNVGTLAGQGISFDVGNNGAYLNLNGYSTTIITSTATNMALNGTGSGGLTVYNTSAGTLTLQGASSYTGPTTINGGMVAINNTGGLGTGGTLSLNGGGVDLGGNSLTLNALKITAAPSGINTIQNGTLTAPSYPFSNSSGNAIISASLQGAGGLTMSGTGGQVTFTASSPYQGATNVTGGTLNLNAAGANTGALPSTSSVTISPGAGLGVQGAASIGSGLTLAGNTSLNLSDSSATTNFAVNGNLSLGAGTQGITVRAEVGNGAADQMTVNGAASVAGTSTVNISANTAIGANAMVFGSYDLITAQSGLALSNFTLGSLPLGFNTYTLSVPNPGALVVTVTGNATPATAYWTGKASAALSDGANNWSNGGSSGTSNWSTTPDGLTDPLQVPGPITNVYFTASTAQGNAGGSLTTTLDQQFVVNSLNFAVTSGTITSMAINTTGNALVIGSGGLTLANGSVSSGSIGGTGGVVVNGSQNWANSSSNQTLTVSAPIMALSGATTLTLNGSGTGAVVLGGQVSNGATGGTLALALNNAGTVTLGSANANTYSGGTTISSGLVQMAGANALGSGPLTVNAGTLNLGAYSQTVGSFSGTGGSIWNNSGAGTATFTVGAGGGTYSGVIANNGGVSGGSVAVAVTNAGGELTLTSPNTYSGGTTLSGGTLNLISSMAIGTGRLTLSGGNLDNTTGGPVVLGSIPQTWSSGFSYFGGSLLDLGTGSVGMTAATPVTVQNSSGTLEIAGTLNGGAQTVTLNSAGPGTLLLAGSVGNIGGGNNIFGNVTLTGTLAAPNVSLLADAASPNTSATTSIAPGGLVNLLAGNTNFAVYSYVIVNGGTINNVSATGGTDNVGIGWVGGQAGVLTINSGLANFANVKVDFGHGTNGTLNLNGGTCILNAEPTMEGQGGSINFNGGTLQLNGNIATFAPTSPAALVLNVGNGANINLNGYSTNINQPLNGVGTGGLTVYNTSAGTLTLSANNTYSGPTQINGGMVDVVVAQSGTGNTYVSGGTLLIDSSGINSGSLGATSVSVSSGATLIARGGASIGTGGNLTLAGGGILDLRDNAANTSFTVNGNLSLGTGTQGSILDIELGNSLTGGSVNVTGSTTLAGTSTINLSALVGSTLSTGQYGLISSTGGGLSAQDFTLNAGSSLKGFDAFSLATTSSTQLILTITGNPTPSTAYWTGKASAALSNTSNQWGVGASIGASNWSTTPDGLTDPLQVPGSITDVYFTAANAAGVAGSLTTTLDTNYSIQGLFLAVSSGSITSVTVNTGTGSNVLTIGGDGLTLAGSNASATISGSGSILLGANQSWANNSNSHPLTVTVPISAASAYSTLSLNGTGAGGVVLSGPIGNAPGGPLSLSFAQSGTILLGGSVANSYSGGTTIAGGTVQLGGNGALGGGGPLTINGGLLDLNGFSSAVGLLSGGPEPFSTTADRAFPS